MFSLFSLSTVISEKENVLSKALGNSVKIKFKVLKFLEILTSKKFQQIQFVTPCPILPFRPSTLH